MTRALIDRVLDRAALLLKGAIDVTRRDEIGEAARPVGSLAYAEINHASPGERIRLIRAGVPARQAKRLTVDLRLDQNILFEALNLKTATVNRKAARGRSPVAGGRRPADRASRHDGGAGPGLAGAGPHPERGLCVTRSVWRIATDAREYEADDPSGTGARITGGRWNDVGVPMIYAAESRALACLETVVHLNAGGLPLNRSLVEIVVPDELWAAAEIETAESLKVGWDAEPAGRAYIAFGSAWAEAKRSVLLFVPSVIVPEECNILINAAHPDRDSLRVRKVRKWLYEPRLAGSA